MMLLNIDDMLINIDYIYYIYPDADNNTIELGFKDNSTMRIIPKDLIATYTLLKDTIFNNANITEIDAKVQVQQ